jgi:uncharacterized protein YkwD
MPAGHRARPSRRQVATVIVASLGIAALAVMGAATTTVLFGTAPPGAVPAVIPTSTVVKPTTKPSPTRTSPKPKAQPTTHRVTTTAVPGALSAMETQVLDLTNAERAKAGCAGLRLDLRLRTAARAHSTDMAVHNYFSHTGRDGSDPGDRMADAGYNIRRGWAENIAAGYPTAKAVMAGWMNSPGHRANILNCRLRALGVGVARSNGGRLYWTQDFGA